MYEFRLYFNDILLLKTFLDSYRAFAKFCDYFEDNFVGVARCQLLFNGKTMRYKTIGTPPKKVYNPYTKKWYSFDKFARHFQNFPLSVVERYKKYLKTYGF